MMNDCPVTRAAAPGPIVDSFRSQSSINPRSSISESRTVATESPSRIDWRISANLPSVLTVRSLSIARSGTSTSSKCCR